MFASPSDAAKYDIVYPQSSAESSAVSMVPKAVEAASTASHPEISQASYEKQHIPQPHIELTASDKRALTLLRENLISYLNHSLSVEDVAMGQWLLERFTQDLNYMAMSEKGRELLDKSIPGLYLLRYMARVSKKRVREWATCESM